MVSAGLNMAFDTARAMRASVSSGADNRVCRVVMLSDMTRFVVHVWCVCGCVCVCVRACVTMSLRSHEVQAAKSLIVQQTVTGAEKEGIYVSYIGECGIRCSLFPLDAAVHLPRLDQGWVRTLISSSWRRSRWPPVRAACCSYWRLSLLLVGCYTTVFG